MRLRIHTPGAPAVLPALRTVPTPALIKWRNLRRAMQRWKQAGCPLTPGRVRRVRVAICATCPHWAGAGNFGLGECRAPGCGCTRAKAWLATEACPLGKWAAVPPPAGLEGPPSP